MSMYDTLDDAAAAGLAAIDKLVNKDGVKRREYIGVLYQDPETGKYMFTEPQTSERKGKSKGKFKIPKGSARGIYHNHPDFRQKTDNRFSPDDIVMSNKSRLRSYIQNKGEIYSYDPSRGKRPSKDGVSGDSVIAKYPTDLIPAKKTTAIVNNTVSDEEIQDLRRLVKAKKITNSRGGK